MLNFLTALGAIERLLFDPFFQILIVLLLVSLVIWLLAGRWLNVPPDEIYTFLVMSLVSTVVFYPVIGACCRFLANRDIITMPTDWILFAIAWAISLGFGLYLAWRD